MGEHENATRLVQVGDYSVKMLWRGEGQSVMACVWNHLSFPPYFGMAPMGLQEFLAGDHRAQCREVVRGTPYTHLPPDDGSETQRQP